MLRQVLVDLQFGLDSFVLCIGLGPLCRSRSAWLVLAAAFGLADGGGALLGSALAAVCPALPAWSSLVAPAAIAAYGALVLIAASRIRSIATSWVGLASLPPLLSIDNIVGGLRSGDDAAVAVSQALGMTIATGALALVGCALGTTVVGGRRLRGFLPGGAAIAAALVMGFT